MNPKISIVLPVYNGEKFISAAIDSILNQTYKNIELIVVNDCSTDGTKAILNKYALADERIRIIENLTNQKLPGSLNIGFRAATGDFFTWTSDDNLYHPSALSLMLNVLLEKEDISLVYADYNLINENGDEIGTISNSEPNGLCFKSSVGACFLYRRQLSEQVGEYAADCYLAEDYDFFIRCYEKGKLMHLPLVLYDYRVHENSLTSTKANEIKSMTKKVMLSHYDFLYSKCTTREDKNRFYRRLINLTADPGERNKFRNRLYLKDRAFALSDVPLRIKNRFTRKHVSSPANRG